MSTCYFEFFTILIKEHLKVNKVLLAWTVPSWESAAGSWLYVNYTSIKLGDKSCKSMGRSHCSSNSPFTSNTALLHSGLGDFFVVGDCPACCRVFSCIPGFYLRITVASLHPWRNDSPECLQTLPNAPRGQSTPGGERWLWSLASHQWQETLSQVLFRLPWSTNISRVQQHWSCFPPEPLEGTLQHKGQNRALRELCFLLLVDFVVSGFQRPAV